VPTPSPPVFCTVPNFDGVNTSSAPAKWTKASFTGTITFSPAAPPPYSITWQSLTASTTVLCTSNITLQELPPAP
ncbi:MAG: hypothetical protein ABIZ52_05315, partial [Candidatus Limnocylindrales bacterium]